MNIEIVGRPEFYFELTLPEVEALIRLAESHYDGACQNAAKPSSRRPDGMPNGLLVIWKNSWFGEDDKTKPRRLSATWRELDLVLKITEIWHSGGGSDEDNKIASKLHFAFHRAMTHFTSALSKKWTETFDASPNGGA